MILRNIFISIRVPQWSKNLFVFAPLIFSGYLLIPQKLTATIITFFAYCLAASGAYLLNDSIDAKSDRMHPQKMSRPIANGCLSIPIALACSCIFFAGSILATLFVHPYAAATIGTYILLNIAYSLLLQKILIVDILCVASGFLLRVWTGSIVIDVAPSEWLLLSTFLVALLIAAGKRKSEILSLGDEAANHRETLNRYSIPFLDQVLGLITAASIVSFSLYTFTKAASHPGVIFITIFVIYGLLRYLYLLNTKRRGTDPLVILATDLPSIINGCAWVGAVIYTIYFR